MNNMKVYDKYYVQPDLKGGVRALPTLFAILRG